MNCRKCSLIIRHSHRVPRRVRGWEYLASAERGCVRRGALRVPVSARDGVSRHAMESGPAWRLTAPRFGWATCAKETGQK